MSLDAAVAYARAHHPHIAAARARVAAARADATVPRAQWLPAIGALVELVGATANNSTASFVSNAAVDLPRIGGTPMVGDEPGWQPYPSTLAAVGVRQTVFDFGRFAAQSAAFDLLADAEDHRASGVGLDLRLNVGRAYYAVLAARAVLAASEQALERARNHRDLARAVVASDLRPPIELTRAEADVARFEAGKIRAEGGLRVARSVFAAAAGVPDAELDATETKHESTDLPPLESTLARAEARDPLVLEARARLSAQQAQTVAVRAQLRPHLFATASFSGRGGGAPPNSGPPSPLDGWVPATPNWNVALVLSWPLFDATVLARGAASRAREDALRADVAVVRRSVVTAAQLAYREVEIAQQTLSALERAAVAARANYAQADARFKATLGSSVELADAETLRTEAEIQLALGKFQLARARMALERATMGSVQP